MGQDFIRFSSKFTWTNCSCSSHRSFPHIKNPPISTRPGGGLAGLGGCPPAKIIPLSMLRFIGNQSEQVKRAVSQLSVSARENK